MQSRTATLTRLRYSLANFPEVVALVSFLALFVFFAVAADNFLTPFAMANILTFASITWLYMRKMNDLTRDALGDVGIEIQAPSERVGKLSGGERQSIAIGRAVHFGARLLILDEPTSALSVAETRKVLTYTLNAKERGLSVIFISHNVRHVYQVADAYTILRRGRKVGTYTKGELTENDIADLITGEREY